MKKRLFTLALLLALLPVGMVAQTTETVDGLPYLKETGTGKYYINISSTTSTYVTNANLRTQLRNLNPNSNKNIFYKDALDGFTELTIPSASINDYKGIKYFRNVKTLTVTNSATGTVTMDVSGTKIEKVIVKGSNTTSISTFNFTTGDDDAVKKTLDVSGLQRATSTVKCTGKGIETLILNNGTTSFKGSTLTLTGSGISGELDATGLTALSTLNIANTATTKIVGLETLTNLTTLNISGTKIGGVLDLTNNTKLSNLNIKHTPIEELNAEGLTSLSTITIKPDNDYLGAYKYYNYNPATGEGTRLRKINVKGCTSLEKLLITDETGGVNSPLWFCRTVLEEINAEGCTNLTTIRSVNGKISKLNVRNCNKLDYVCLIQNMLTTEALIEGGLAACPVTSLNLHRNRLSSIDFITTPSSAWPQEWKTLAGTYLRTQTLVDRLQKLWVNGGSYVRRDYIGTDKNAEYTNAYDHEIEKPDNSSDYYAWWIEPGDEYTNTIRDINLQYANSLIYLQCGDNLLRNIDLTKVGPNLKQLEIVNNLFTVLDMSGVNRSKLTQRTYAHQVTFKDLKVLKGGVQQNADKTYPKGADGACIPDVLREDGENDMILLPLDDYAKDKILSNVKVGTEDLSDSRTDAHNYDETVADAAGKMDIIHLKEGDEMKYYMKTHDGEIHKHSDIDMHRMVLDYNYDTELLNESDDALRNINVKVHTDPYVVYLNPATRSGEGIDYYSGTVCVSYQWEVPKGIEAYIAVGVNDTKMITDKGTTAADGQLNLVCIGKEGDIIPKNTAVYLRSVPAFENVVKADGTTPAKTFDVDGKNLSHVAGFYDLQNNWEPKYLGWRNTKGAGAVDDRVRLYIEKEGPTKATVMGNYVMIDGVSTEITEDLLYNRNLFKCYKVEDTTPTEAIYYDTFDPNAKYHYNFPNMATVDNDGSTPLKNNILTLGRETKIGTKMIGFWPYYGANPIGPHRCYIKISDIVELLSSSSSSGLSSLSRGLTFHFDNSAETGVREFATVETADTKDNAWYTLSGMRLQEKPTQPGMYINNGKKVYLK